MKIHAHRSFPVLARLRLYVSQAGILTSNSIVAMDSCPTTYIRSDREFAVQPIERKSHLRGEIG